MVSAQELGLKAGEAIVYEGTAVKPLSYLEAAPLVKAAGQHAAGTLFVLERRYDELKRFAAEHGAVGSGTKWKREDLEQECPWSTNYFDTSTAALASENMIGIQHSSPQVAALTPKTELYSAGLKLTGFLNGGNIQMYHGDIRNILGGGIGLKEKEVVNGDDINLAWLGFAEGKKQLVGDITPLIFKALKDCYGRHRGMATYFDLRGILRPVVLYGSFDGADCSGNGRLLGNNDVRLVGLHSQEKEACAASASIDVRMGE